MTRFSSTSPTNVFDQALQVCPPEVESRIRQLPYQVVEQIEELRFRMNAPLQVCGTGVDAFLHRDGGLTKEVADAFIITPAHMSRIVQVVTQSSLYAFEDELRRGYVTMPGGHRVGVAGRAVLYESGSVRTIRSISALNVRIAKEHLGSADFLRPLMFRSRDESPYNVLIISPPQCGKTTLLRDVARQWSEGVMTPSGRGEKVSVVDERSEIAGCRDGAPQFRLGPRTDVLDACPKAEGMLMMIRSMSPTVIVTDEIGREADRDAIMEATHAGVAVIATAHAASLEEWKGRPFMDELFASKAFHRYVLLSRRNGPGTVEGIYDERGMPMKFTAATSKVN